VSSSLYVSLSAQVALERRLNTLANNIANMNTAGFRAEEVKFETILSRAARQDVAFASTGETFISRRTGPISHTGNPLDVAVDGDGWLAIATPSGTAYTRDGRLRITEAGELQSAAGYPVLDPGGSAILLDPAGGEVRIASDGMITQGNLQVGALGLFLIPEGVQLERFENSAVIPSEPAVPVEDLTTSGVRQGYVEGANVNPVMEMTKLIMLQRTFESAASAIQQSEAAEQEAIRTLGPS
jgi:flagellar basal-body rod protein FlgF